MPEELTVKTLHERLAVLIEKGYSDMKICVDDILVKTDELCYSYFGENATLFIRPMHIRNDRYFRASAQS